MTLYDPKNMLVHIVRRREDRGYNGMMFYFICGGDCHGEKWVTPTPPYGTATCFQCIAKEMR